MIAAIMRDSLFMRLCIHFLIVYVCFLRSMRGRPTAQRLALRLLQAPAFADAEPASGLPLDIGAGDPLVGERGVQAPDAVGVPVRPLKPPQGALL